MLSKQASFIALCLTVVTVSLGFILSTKVLYRPNYSADGISLNFSVELKKFIELQSVYHSKLAQVPRHQYGPTDSHVTYGEPVKALYLKSNVSTANVKRILAWTPFFGIVKWIPEEITGAANVVCKVTFNKDDLSVSDAVIMHPRDMPKGVKSAPEKRYPFQRWVYFLQESPYATGINVREFNGIFNWTAVYRRDSDFSAGYVQTELREPPLSDGEFLKLFSSIVTKKKKLVAYMNSNCGAPHTDRLNYVKKLQAYITVDMYGSCGTLKCPRKSTECTEKISQYYFYLAMENAHCRDYITEKVTQPLTEWSAVPVVMGADDPGNYKEMLPPGSYIHTSGFDSPKELAEYLLLVAQNPLMYEQFHKWRQTTFVRGSPVWENMCTALHNESLPAKTYTDFSGWYNEDTCKT